LSNFQKSRRWTSVGSVILIAALVFDFAWVIVTALGTH